MPQQPWAAEHRVSSSLAAHLIFEQFPHLKPTVVELIGEGWDNVAYRVNGQYVFRFPRRTIALQLLETERLVLPRIAPRLPLPVPIPDLVGRAGPKFPWPFLGHRLLPGETGCAVELTDDERTALAKPLGEFLSALHGISAVDAASFGAGPDSFDKLDFAVRVPQARVNLEKIKGWGLFSATAPLLEILERTLPELPPEQCLVHGDLYARHLLFDSDRKLCGVIDWGDSHVGHPITDLAIAFAISHASVITTYAYESGDESLLRVAVKALELIGSGTG